MLKEFKEFILRGNVLDLAVAVIIGGAFGKVISSLVTDILMPPLGLILGKVDFNDLYINMSGTPYASLAEAQAAGALTLNYGVFLDNLISFLIIGAAVFLIIKLANSLQRLRPVEKPAPTTKECPFCISSIPIKATRCPNCTSEIK
ncbi:MAG: large conductance mechanosensitive channel protein MscL [Anaerolineales bacterium]|nr:large conductance mechanosensitive channel protein MscL [Anaerolineales bacterium]